MTTIEHASPDTSRKVADPSPTDMVTHELLCITRANHIPVIGVYETTPVPRYDYESWMLAEVRALTNAVTHGTSAPKM
jgi:zinc/manganese transport system substrate-binding protein